MPLITGIIGIVGALLGGLMTFLTTSHMENKKQGSKARQLALAFQGEIKAILHIVQRRQYLQGIQQLLTEMNATGERRQLQIKVRRNYILVFENNVSKIGLLPRPLPGLISQFYVQIKSVLEDIESHTEGDFNILGHSEYMTFLHELYFLLEETVQIGKILIKETERIYPEQQKK